MLLRVNFNHETRNFEHSTGADSRCSFQAERRETEQKRYCHTKSSLAQKWQTGIVLLFFIENEQLALGITEIRLEEIHPLSGNEENYNFVLWKKKWNTGVKIESIFTVSVITTIIFMKRCFKDVEEPTLVDISLCHVLRIL